MAKERALDLFGLLGQLDRKDFAAWEKMTEEQRKEVSPYMLLRWLACTDDPEQLIQLADVANLCIFSIPEDRELLLKILAACTRNGTKRYAWVNYKVSGKKRGKAHELLMAYYKLSPKEADDCLRLFTNDELLELALESGWQKDEVAELKKGFK